MNKFEQFVEKHFNKLALFLLIVTFLNTCGNPNKITNKLKRKYKIIELKYDFNDSELKNKFKLEDFNH